MQGDAAEGAAAKPPTKGVSRGERVALRASSQAPPPATDPAPAPLSARGRAPPQLHIPVVDDQAVHAGPASAREPSKSHSSLSLDEGTPAPLQAMHPCIYTLYKAPWGSPTGGQSNCRRHDLGCGADRAAQGAES